MINADVYFNKVVEPAALRSAIASVLGIAPASIFIAEEPHLSAPHGDVTLLRLERLVERGEFPMRLGFWPLDDVNAPTSIEELRRLCEVLDCRVLVEDGSHVPDQYIEINAQGPQRTVLLDEDKSEEGENVIEMIIEEQSADSE